MFVLGSADENGLDSSQIARFEEVCALRMCGSHLNHLRRPCIPGSGMLSLTRPSFNQRLDLLGAIVQPS